MAFTLSGSTITQSGTDTSLAGLNGIAGVTVWNDGLITTYFTNNAINITGNLSINPLFEKIAFGLTAPFTNFNVSSTGRLTVGIAYEVGSEKYYSTGVWLTTSRKASAAWSGENAFNNNGVFNYYGGTMEVVAGVSIGGTPNFKAGEFVLLPTNNQNARFFGSTTGNIENVTLRENGINFNVKPNSFKNVKLINAQNLGLHGSTTPGLTGLIIEDYDYIRQGNVLPFANNLKWQLKNAARGSATSTTILQNYNDHLIITKDVILNLKNTSNQLLEGIVSFIKDVNNGQRENNQGVNFVNDRVYIQTSVNGVTNINNILTLVKTSLGTSTGTKTDYRGKTTVAGEDLFDIHNWGYEYQYRSLSNTALKGIGVLSINAELLNDQNVTLSEANAITKLASSFSVNTTTNTITVTANSTLDDLYDVMKIFKTRNVQAQLEYPTISTQPVTANGDTLVTAMNVVGLEFLTAGTKFKKLQANGTANGTISNLTVNGNVTQATPTNLSNVVITGTLTYNTNTATSITITNTTIGTVANSGTGIVTITPTNSTITTYTDTEINFLDSSINISGSTSNTAYPTATDRNNNTNALATWRGEYKFKYAGAWASPIFLKMDIGFTAYKDVVIALGENVIDLGTTGLLASIQSTMALESTNQSIKTKVNSLENTDLTLVAKELTSQGIKTDVQNLNNYNNSTYGLWFSRLEAIKSKTDQLVFTGANLNTVAKVVEDKIGYALTTGERQSIAVAVEQAILNENDGQAILNAIVGAIGNQNIDQIALVAAIRADIERAGGISALIKAKVDTLENTDISTLSKKADTDLLLKDADYVAPDNDSISKIKTNTDLIPGTL